MGPEPMGSQFIEGHKILGKLKINILYILRISIFLFESLGIDFFEALFEL